MFLCTRREEDNRGWDGWMASSTRWTRFWVNSGSWCWSRRSATTATAKSLQSCPTLCDPKDQPTRLCRPWDSPSKNTGVRCHFLLQCVKMKSASEVAQSCLTLSDPMDCSPPGSSIHGIFQARVLEWGAIAFSQTGRPGMLQFMGLQGVGQDWETEVNWTEPKWRMPLMGSLIYWTQAESQ